MRRMFILFFAVAAVLTLAPTRTVAGVKDLCAARWPGDRAKQKACFYTHYAALKNVSSFKSRHDIGRKLRAAAKGQIKVGPFLRMYARCGERWEIKRYQTLDWVKYARCLAKRERAYLAKRRADKRAARAAGRVEAIEMIRKMPNISVVAWAGKDKRNHLNVHVHERGQDYASDGRAYCDLLKTNGVRGAKVSVWSADAKKKSPPKEVLLTHRLC